VLIGLRTKIVRDCTGIVAKINKFKPTYSTREKDEQRQQIRTQEYLSKREDASQRRQHRSELRSNITIDEMGIYVTDKEARQKHT
jgi:hypothetical protein